MNRRVYSAPMSPGNDNQIDWTAAATPEGESLLPSPWRRQKAGIPPQSKRGVTDASLRDEEITAMDPGGGDPYNATGRQFRR